MQPPVKYSFQGSSSVGTGGRGRGMKWRMGVLRQVRESLPGRTVFEKSQSDFTWKHFRCTALPSPGLQNCTMKGEMKVLIRLFRWNCKVFSFVITLKISSAIGSKLLSKTIRLKIYHEEIHIICKRLSDMIKKTFSTFFLKCSVT